MNTSSPGASTIKSPETHCDFRAEFFQRMGDSEQFRRLFEHLPNIYFFVKDEQGRMVCASLPIVKRLGYEHEIEIIGTTDFDHFPQHIAENFQQDDQTVLQTGQPIINRLEIWYDEQRMLDWFLTNKLPVFDSDEKVIGVMGTVRSYAGQRQSSIPYSQIDDVVEYIRANLRSRLVVADLAEIANLSPRQLHRRFREVFGMNVQEFLGRTRIQAACDALLHTTQSIAQIAAEFGYCDQSAFTQQFRKHLGTTPHQFRRIQTAPTSQLQSGE